MTQFISKSFQIGITLTLLSFCLPVSSYALCQATLQWDACTSLPEGYIVFGRAEGEEYNYDEPWWTGDASFTECSIDGLEENANYYFVVRAYIGENVSADSNEVAFSCTGSDALQSDSSGGTTGDSDTATDTTTDSTSDGDAADTTTDSTSTEDEGPSYMEGSSSLTSDSDTAGSSASGSSSGCFIDSLIGGLRD